jgi:hypothetical protein
MVVLVYILLVRMVAAVEAALLLLVQMEQVLLEETVGMALLLRYLAHL